MSKSAVLFACIVSSFAVAAHAQVLALKSPTKSNATPHVLDDDAVRTIALTFEDAVRRRDHDALVGMFDHAALIERASKGIPTTEKVKRAFRSGELEAWDGDSGFIASAMAITAAGGTVRWLRPAAPMNAQTNAQTDARSTVHSGGSSMETAAERTVLFRLTRADASAPEYIELILAAHGERGAVAVDFESSTDAVPYSRVLRRWLLALVDDAGRSLPERIAGEDREFALAGATFAEIDQAFEAGRNTDALAAWAKLPENLRADPSVVLARLRAAFAAGAPTFDSALQEVRATGLADESVELLAIDVAMATNRPARALNALDALARFPVRDPYLDSLRGSILRDSGRRDEARAACRRAIEADPQIEDAYWTLLGLAIEERRNDEALSLLTALDEHFVIRWDGIEDSPAYQAFLESKPGSRWRMKVASKR